MVSVSLHPFDIPAVLYARIKDPLLYIFLKIPVQQFLSVFCYKYKMDHQQVFIMPSVLEAVIIFFHKNLLFMINLIDCHHILC